MLRELDAFWRLVTPEWGQRRAHEGPQVPFWAILAFSGAEMASLGVLWESFGGPLYDFLRSLDVLLAAVGCLGGPLGVPGSSWEVPGRLGCDFRDFPGDSGTSLGSILGCFFDVFSDF